jgi:hypothetical protein
MNGNCNIHTETSMGSKPSFSANGTGIQAEMSKLFRLENRTIVCKAVI